MRIDRLDLIAYGTFTKKTLDLCDGKFGLHLIYGDNEAGKSTTLRALIAWLFGIPNRTTDSFVHSNSQLRIGGKLRLSDGKELEFIRRKGTKGTLLKYGTDEPLDDTILAPYLPSAIDEDIFTKLFGIDHVRLVEGGRELLNQSGDLGQALFSAAVGTASLRETLSELQSEAEEIYKPRASTKILNQAISNYRDAQRRIKNTSLPTAKWKELQQDLSQTLSDIKQMEKQIESRNIEKSRLDRLNRVKGVLAEHRSLLSRIDGLGTVLLLPEDFEEKRKTATEKLQSSRESKEKAETKLKSLEEEAATLNINNELMKNEVVILEIFKELGAVEKTIKDRPQQDGKRRLLRNEAESLLKSVRPDLKLDNADDLRPLLNNKKWISRLAQQHVLLAQKKAKARSTLRDIEDEQESKKNELDKQPQSNSDLGELKATIVSARKAGDVEQRLANLQKRASGENFACENEFATLGKFKGTLESLLKAPIPVSETLDIFEKKGDELSNSIRDCLRIQKEIQKETKQTEQELRALLLTSHVPTIYELEESRNSRDTVWGLIKQKYIEKIDIVEDLREYASGSELPTVYEEKVNTADLVSDRLRLVANQVAKRAALEAKLENLKSRLDDIAKELETAKETQNDFQKAWSAIWEPLGITPDTPREMKQWILRVEKLVKTVQSANAIGSELQTLVGQINALRQDVSSQIATFDESLTTQEMNLESMVSLCEQRVQQEESNHALTRELKKSLRDSAIHLKRTQDELKSIEDEESAWLGEWRQAIIGLGLREDVPPECATETFDRLFKFFDTFDRSEDLRKRIYGMDQVEEKFNKRVFRFADEIGFEREGQEAATIATQLHRDLNAAREDRAKLQKIEAHIKEKRVEIEEAAIEIRAAENQLASLRKQAGVETDEDLRGAGQQSKTYRHLQQRLETIGQELNRNGDGLSIEELEKEADESEIDAIDGELEKISASLKELQTKKEGLLERKYKLQTEIEEKDGGDLAANASQEAQEYFTIMASSAEQYIRLRIAALILEQRIEDYRKKNQAPILARAGELFSRLTLGSYASLRDELDETGKPILFGVRPDDTEVKIEGMSDGSRDQLYLALRLATLEQHLSKGEPIPFIVDDILIGFDDKRTKVCLEVLAELAECTQVLLFTHHIRVLELAKNVDAKAGIYTVSLITGA